jgi:hypothetical protein
VLELVDSRNDLKFETAAKTVGREIAIRAKEGAGPDAWKSFRTSVEAHGAEGVGKAVEREWEMEPMTRKNVRKALAFRTAPVAQEGGAAASSEGEAPEADEDVPRHPSTTFLDRAYHHYLHSLATFSLSTAPTPDPLRTVKQLTQRLTPSDARGAPRPVLTVPLAGRTPRAGERTDGWASTIEKGEKTVKKGGPISRAKGSRGKHSRRQMFTGTKQSEEELAGSA